MPFPVSGVECSPLLPPLIAFLIACVTTPAGVSGAFLLLPFQMSVLGFTSPGVTPTNLIYNIIATPGGVYRFIREGRMDWRLALLIAAGSMPGVFAGAAIRVRYLPDPAAMRVFVASVLLYLAWRLARRPGKPAVYGRGAVTRYVPGRMLLVSTAVGVVGGIYGIGGGAIIAPFLMGVCNLPAAISAGPALFGTLITSIAGVSAFAAMGGSARPDWALGLLFGIGGLAGTYCGARFQRYLPERFIRLMLAVLITTLAGFYLTRAVLD